MANNSIFAWGASDPARKMALHIERGDGVFFYDRDGKKYIDWSSGAVCSNMGHTVPESVKKAAMDQFN